jgi:hypothetical protein
MTVRTSSKFLKSVAVALAFVAGALAFSPAAQAAGDLYDRLFSARAVPAYVTADDTDVALHIVYVGTKQSGTVQVGAAGDLLFKEGASGAESNTGVVIKCPGGGTEGTIDVSDAACNTVKEVVDACNVATSPFRCVPIDSLLADATDAAGNLFLVAAAAKANKPDGVKVFWDTSTAFQSTRLLSPYRTANDYLLGDGKTISPTPYDGLKTIFLRGTFNSTYGAGSSKVQVIDSLLTFAGTNNVASETTALFLNEAGGGTGADKTFDLGAYGIHSDLNHRLLTRIVNTAAASAVKQNGFGLFFRYPKEAASLR